MTFNSSHKAGKKGILIDTKCQFSLLVFAKCPHISFLILNLCLGHLPIDLPLYGFIDFILIVSRVVELAWTHSCIGSSVGAK